MARIGWVITVVAPDVKWSKATASALVKEAGLPLCAAMRWAIVRREMSPAGLKRKLASQRN
jgi:hypothetical protein